MDTNLNNTPPPTTTVPENAAPAQNTLPPENNNFPISSGNKKKMLILLTIIVLILGVVAATTFALMNNTNKNINNNTTPLTTVPTNTQTSTIPTQIPTEEALASASPSPTLATDKNQNTYTNSTYMFQIKYPETVEQHIIPKRDNLLLGGASFGLKYNDDVIRYQASQIYVYVFESNGLSLTEWLEANSTTQAFGTEPAKEFHEYKVLETSTINDLPAVKFQNKVFDFPEVNTAVKKGNYIYVIGVINVADNLTTTYNQMLPTFNFIK